MPLLHPPDGRARRRVDVADSKRLSTTHSRAARATVHRIRTKPGFRITDLEPPTVNPRIRTPTHDPLFSHRQMRIGETYPSPTRISARLRSELTRGRACRRSDGQSPACACMMCTQPQQSSSRAPKIRPDDDPVERPVHHPARPDAYLAKVPGRASLSRRRRTEVAARPNKQQAAAPFRSTYLDSSQLGIDAAYKPEMRRRGLDEP
ncbi:hypothetical protein FKP32DRAFT_1365251 [Trametes sanguinea]|nr:hypothetical protein FKP32DRAFT_1365251 [Trametes sanguinea]